MAHLDRRIDPSQEAKPQDAQPVKDATSGTSAAKARDAAAARASGTRGADPDVPQRRKR
jgi:hypothetical protein